MDAGGEACAHPGAHDAWGSSPRGPVAWNAALRLIKGRGGETQNLGSTVDNEILSNGRCRANR